MVVKPKKLKSGVPEVYGYNDADSGKNSKKDMTCDNNVTWCTQKRFYTRGTLRGIRISIFANIPILYRENIENP